MRPTSSPADTVPLLFRHAMARTSSAELPGHFDPASQVWVIETEAGPVSVAQGADASQLETRTSTRVREEGDDDDLSGNETLCAALLDTSTLTKVRQESADDDFSTDEAFGARRTGLLAALATKTDVQQESDDEMSASAFLELETRTLNNQEGLDADWPRMLFELQTETFSNVEIDVGYPRAH